MLRDLAEVEISRRRRAERRVQRVVHEVTDLVAPERRGHIILQAAFGGALVASDERHILDRGFEHRHEAVREDRSFREGAAGFAEDGATRHRIGADAIEIPQRVDRLGEGASARAQRNILRTHGDRAAIVEVVGLALPAIVAEHVDFIAITNRHGGVPHHAIGAVGRLAELVARGTRRLNTGSDQRGDFRARH